MTLSIIILAYRDPALLRLCLKSLARSLAGTDMSYEVVVVDNATSPETANVVRAEFADAFPAIRLIPLVRNTGYTYGVNTGLRAATGEYLFVLNHDIIMQPDTCQRLVTYLREHPSVGLVGPRLLNFDDSQQDSCFRFYTPLVIPARRLPLPFTKRLLSRFRMEDTTISGPTAVDWVSGAAFATSRTAMEQVGTLDERFFHYFSDVDWAWRFWEHGYSVVYYPLATLRHYLGRTSKSRFGIFDVILNRATRWHIADAIRYFFKHGFSGTRPTRATNTAQPTLIHA